MTPLPGEDRAVRAAELTLRIAIVVAAAALSFALFLRFRAPEAILAADEHQGISPEEQTAELGVVAPSATVGDSLSLAPEPGAPAVRAGAAPLGAETVTDVVLLPCSEPNPRADGRYLVPPHDPTHRTIVGLPSRPGEPRRGFVIPPHDPGVENRIPLELVPLDSILDHTVRIPPHDPTRYKLVGRDTVPCLTR